jgi:hypothetical protein
MSAGPIPELQLTDGEIKFYQREGYLLLPGLMSEKHAADLYAEVMDLMQAIGGFDGNKLKQSTEFKSGSHIEALIYSHALRGIAQQLMGGSSTPYLPSPPSKASAAERFTSTRITTTPASTTASAGSTSGSRSCP